jgi:hypothetical protein
MFRRIAFMRQHRIHNVPRNVRVLSLHSATRQQTQQQRRVLSHTHQLKLLTLAVQINDPTRPSVQHAHR